MQTLFPPGDMNSSQRSNWREFSFALHQVQSAIEPSVSLKKVIDSWSTIRGSLKEANRKRTSQLSKYTFS